MGTSWHYILKTLFVNDFNKINLFLANES